jgi:hypothetical protein
MDHGASRLWEDMLDEFRALGGTADNVCLRTGRFGRGLFACDPSKPARLHVPESLLVDVGYIRFRGNDFFLSPSAPIDMRRRAFIESYQREFGWGTGRGPTEELLFLMRDAQGDLRELLRDVFDTELWLLEPTPQYIQERFFASRYISYKGRGVIMPVLDLVNHGHAVLFDKSEGIGIGGRFDGEILTRYCFTDALDIFNNWGFASEEQAFALSLRLEIPGPSGLLKIGRGDVGTEPGREPFLPEVTIEGGHVALSYLLLGHKDRPGLAREVFRRIMSQAGWGDADGLFDRIRQINLAQFETLIAATASASPPLGGLLRDVARHQLAALSGSSPI